MRLMIRIEEKGAAGAGQDPHGDERTVAAEQVLDEDSGSKVVAARLFTLGERVVCPGIGGHVITFSTCSTNGEASAAALCPLEDSDAVPWTGTNRRGDLLT